MRARILIKRERVWMVSVIRLPVQMLPYWLMIDLSLKGLSESPPRVFSCSHDRSQHRFEELLVFIGETGQA